MSPFRPSRAAAVQASHDRQTYIPPQVQRAMDQHMQQYMPAHMKHQAGAGGYIPMHMERAMTKQMQRNLPSHMKKYVGAYMQQSVVSPNRTINAGNFKQSPSAVTPHAPTPYIQAQNHFQSSDNQNPTGNYPQGQVIAPDAPSQVANDQTAPNDQAVPNNQAVPTPPTNAYDFIVDPTQSNQSRGFSLLGESSMIVRVGFIAGALLVLLIFGSVIKNIVIKKPSFEGYVAVLQDQQELVHLTKGAEKQTTLSTDTTNFAMTTELAISSSKSRMLGYLVLNKHKVKDKILNQKISLTIDNQLADSAEATTYDQTFRGIMETKLTAYMKNLKHTYDTSAGAKGRAILEDDYAQAELLLQQVKSIN